MFTLVLSTPKTFKTFRNMMQDLLREIEEIHYSEEIVLLHCYDQLLKPKNNPFDKTVDKKKKTQLFQHFF